MKGFTVLNNADTTFPTLRFVLGSLDHVSLILYDDNKTQLADTSKIPFEIYSPKLVESELNKFLVKHTGRYWQYIHSGTDDFEKFWEF